MRASRQGDKLLPPWGSKSGEEDLSADHRALDPLCAPIAKYLFAFTDRFCQNCEHFIHAPTGA